MSDARFVLDSNILVSAAILQKSLANKVYVKAWTSGVLLASTALVEELKDVLSRKKFDRYVSQAIRLEFLESFTKEAEFVAISEHITASRDPKDDMILELAVSGAAKCIVSGDLDLTTLSPFRDIPIYTPAIFLEMSWETPEAE